MSSHRTDWISIVVVILSGVVAALQVGKVPISLPLLRADLGLDLQAAGWVMGVFAILGVIGGIPAGAAVSRFGDRRLIVAGLLMLALGSMIGAFATDFAVLLGSRVVEGTGFLMFVVAVPSVLNRIAAPQDRHLAFGMWGTFMPTGIALAMLAGLAVEHWHAFWLINAALLGFAATLVVLTVRRSGSSAASLSWRDMVRDTGVTISARGPLLLAGSFALYNVQYFALISFLPVFLLERMGVSATTAGVLSAVVVGANVVGNLAAGVLLGRGVARSTLMAVASAVMGVTGIGIFAAAVPAAFVFPLCLVCSATAGLLPATVLGAAPQLAPVPRLAPVSVGLLIQGNNLGQVIGPVIVGTIVDRAGWSFAAIPAAIAAVFGVMMAMGLRR